TKATQTTRANLAEALDKNTAARKAARGPKPGSSRSNQTVKYAKTDDRAPFVAEQKIRLQTAKVPAGASYRDVVAALDLYARGGGGGAEDLKLRVEKLETHPKPIGKLANGIPSRAAPQSAAAIRAAKAASAASKTSNTAKAAPKAVKAAAAPK